MKPSKNECYAGFKLSLENSKNFIDDAKLLFKTGSYGHSLSLSMLAMEECGKAGTLLVISDGIMELDKELTKFIFRNHKAKIMTSLYNLALSKNFPKAEIDYIKSIAPQLDSAKQRGFYVDYFNKKWVTPQDDDLIKMAEVNLNYTEKVYDSLMMFLTHE